VPGQRKLMASKMLVLPTAFLPLKRVWLDLKDSWWF
jgi:hypothetical protein